MPRTQRVGTLEFLKNPVGYSILIDPPLGREPLDDNLNVMTAVTFDKPATRAGDKRNMPGVTFPIRDTLQSEIIALEFGGMSTSAGTW